jgi:hypothetical protein
MVYTVYIPMIIFQMTSIDHISNYYTYSDYIFNVHFQLIMIYGDYFSIVTIFQYVYFQWSFYYY